MSPLSKDQKRDIGIASRKAYLAWDGRENYELVNSDNYSRSACFESWRHVEQGKAVGLPSLRLRDANQDHYNRILGHYKHLAGDEAGANRQRGRDGDNDRRIARWKLTQALQERGLEVGYAAKICWAKYKCALDQATAGQVWKLIFDVRTRRKPEKKKPIGEVPF